jgi:hypothetical protein
MKPIPLRVLCLASLCLAKATASVVLNEVFYNAPGEREALQWIELHNSGPAPVDLGGWKLRRAAKLEFGKGTILAPGGFAVVARDVAAFQQAYRFRPLAQFEGALKRKGDRIELEDASGKLVDSVVYKDDGAWPEVADGGSSSLERICPDAPGRDPANWGASVPDAAMEAPKGTPGRTNGIHSRLPVPSIRGVDLSPRLPKPGEAIRIRAEVSAATELRKVEAVVRILTPGRESQPVTHPMERDPNGSWVGKLPGIAQGVVRVQVRAVDAAGAERLSPSNNDLLPAVSVAVLPPLPAGRIPQYIVWQGVRRARSNNGEFTAEDQLRWGLQSRFQTETDLGRLWSALLLEGAPAPGRLPRLGAIFRDLMKRRNQMVLETAATEDPAGRMNTLGRDLQEFRKETVAALRPELDAAGRKVAEAWVAGVQAAGAEANADELLRNWLGLDRQFFHATAMEGLDEARFLKLRDGFRAIALRRDALRGEARKVMEGKGNQEKFQESMNALSVEMQQVAASVLDRALLGASRGFRDEAVIFRRAERKEGAESGGRERTAVIHHDPATATTTLVDFASLVNRSAGFKIHLPKGRRIDGMSSINLVFEMFDRFALSEPFAFEFYRRAGMNVPKSGHARLTLDQQDLGYHVFIEQPNRNFLRRAGLAEGGHLYKATWRGETPVEMYEKKTRLVDGHGDLQKTVDALHGSRGDAQWEVIRREFDVAQTIDYFAVNMLLSHWDGYFNNHFAYHDTEGAGRWTFYPWDQDKAAGFYDGVSLDEVFAELPLDYGSSRNRAPGWRGFRQPKTFQEYYHQPGASGWWRQPGWFSGPMLANPTYRALFVARVKHLLQTEFTEEKLGPLLDRYAADLESEVRFKAPLRGMDEGGASARLRQDVRLLKTFIRKRRAFLLADPELKSAGPQDSALWK